MKLTKFYLKYVGVIFAGLFTAGIGIFTIAGNSMIEYHCSAQLPHLFLGQNLSGNPACSLIVTILYILIGSFFLVSLLLVMSTLYDSLVLGFGFVKTRVNRLRQKRKAELYFVSHPIKIKHITEIFITVYNEEFWLQADEVIANTKFISPDNRRVNKNFKWSDGDAKNDAVSIPRKKWKSVHFATINDDQLIVHFVGGDEIFPLPNKIIPYYVIPFHITGSMSFLGFKIKRVDLATGDAVYVYNDGEIQIGK